MNEQKKRLKHAQREYDQLIKKVQVIKKQNNDIKSINESMTNLIEYYYNDWLTDREEVEADYLIMCEDPIYDLITEYYDLIDDLDKTIKEIKSKLKY